MNIRIAPIIPALLVAAIGFSAPELTSSSRRMYTPDPHSMDIVEDDDGIPRMEVRGFTTPTAARTGYNFADILTNRNVNVSNLKVLLRDGTGDNRELKYADLAKIVGYSGGDGGHGVDNLSVKTNSDNNATLVGFDNADDWQWPYKVNGVLNWMSADEITLSNDGTHLGLYYFSSALPGQIPFKSSYNPADLRWGAIVGDEKTVDFEGMKPEDDAKIYLHGSNESSSRDEYAYLDSSGELQWIDPVDGLSTQLDDEQSRAGHYLIKLRNFNYFTTLHELPYNNRGALAWHSATMGGHTNYLAEFGGEFHWVNNPQKGDKGEKGDKGDDGEDADPEKVYELIGEWVTNHVTEVVQLLVGTSNFVTSVNGETGDVVLKKLTIYSWKDNNVVVSEYNGSADVEADCTDANIADSSINAINASNAEFADRAYEADYADRASVANDADYASRAAYAEIAGEIGPPPNSLQLSAPLSKSAAPSTNAVKSASSASPSGLSFSANGSVLTITDGTHTWTLNAQ